MLCFDLAWSVVKTFSETVNNEASFSHYIFCIILGNATLSIKNVSEAINNETSFLHYIFCVILRNAILTEIVSII